MGKAELLPGGQENPWVLDATGLVQVHAVKARLAAYGVTDLRHVTTILAVLDQHGLFHEVTTPKEGDIRKEIGRRAKRMAKDLWNRITDIRKGKRPPADPHEEDLAQRWEQLSADRMRLEELKVLSETFQVNRGGRIFPRYASQESRKRSHKGPRSAPEKSHAAQILDRYLKQECAMHPNRRLECLGDILRSAMNLQGSREEVSEQVRWRLRDAETKTPLDDVDYTETTRVTYETNDDRQKIFWKCQSIIYSPDTSAEKKKKAEDTLEKLFSLE
mgnify:CR=1 FL=1